MNAKHIRLVGITSLLLCTACGETDGPAAGEQFSPYNRLVRDYKTLVTITYVGDDVRVEGIGAELVQVERDPARPARITLRTSSAGLAYFVSGKSEDGQLRIESERPYALYLNNLNLGSTEGPALDSRCADKTYLVLCNKSSNTLSDAGAYPLLADASVGAAGEVPATACLYASGRVIFDGEGTLNITSTAVARYEAAIADTLRIHGLTALRGVETPYAVSVNVQAPGGDGLHVADSTLMLGVGQYNIVADRHVLSCSSANVYLDGGSLYGFAAHGSSVYTPAGCGLIVSSGSCLTAAADSSFVREAAQTDTLNLPQLSWQQRVDTVPIVLAYDSTTLKPIAVTLNAYIGNSSVAKFTATPTASIDAPYLLLSVASLTEGANIRFTK